MKLSAPLQEDPIEAVPWRGVRPPSRILAIRLQAFGDTVATLPYLQALKTLWPGTEIDFLTREETADLPRRIDLFENVFSIGGGRSAKRQLLSSLGVLPRLLARRYDIVIDLQRNRISGLLRGFLRARSWSTFDRFSPRLHGERTRLTIEALGIVLPPVTPNLRPHNPDAGLTALSAAGWDGRSQLVVLNPAGKFPTRTWPTENYIAFAHLWRARRDRDVQFVVAGIADLRPKADYLRAALGARLIDLVGRTTASDAFGVLRRAALIVSEDSGLMHLAWVAGTPTLALFGSTRHVWSGPHGNYSLCLHSGDLPCGACMDTECRFGDVHCLTRYTPERVVDAALSLVEAVTRTPKLISPGTSELQSASSVHV